MLNFKNIQEIIVNSVDKSVQTRGFILQTDKPELREKFNLYRFIRKDNYGNEQYISLKFYKFSKSFKVEVLYKIKISTLYSYLDNIIKELDCDEFVSPRFEFAIYSDIGSVITPRNDHKKGEVEYSYYIYQESDLKEISKLIPNDIQAYVFPFFNHNTSVEKIDLLLNSNESYIYCFYLPACVCYGLLAAKINENPNFNSLAIAYDKEMREPGTDESDKKIFDKLLSELNKKDFSLIEKIDFNNLPDIEPKKGNPIWKKIFNK